MSRALRVCRRMLIVLLQALLLNWAACAPIVWIVRDGLGPDTQEAGWVRSIFKFIVIWGIPAFALALPLIGLLHIERRLASQFDSKPERQN